MFRSLRNRLILSHILPALLIIPLMGVTISYVLETQFLLPRIYGDLVKEARLMAETTRNQPTFWQNNQIAQEFVNGFSPYLSGRVSLVNLDGKILASSGSSGGGSSTQVVELPDLSKVGQGDVIQLQNGPLAEVFAPVFDMNGRPIGVIRMTTQVVTVSSEIYRLRYLLGVVLLFGVLAGIALGSILAVSINRPVQRVTRSIQSLVDDNLHERVQEQGPSEMRMLAHAVNTLVERLSSLEKGRRQLLANMVHELGRPLGAIRSAIHALLNGADKDPQLAHDLLSGLDSETARLKRLLEDLAGLHDSVLGKLELNRVRVNLKEWLAGTISTWEAAAREKGLVWDVEIPAELPIVLMDPDRMAQALGNLLSNAVKFTPAGGWVSTTLTIDTDQLILQVVDSGAGIPAEEREQIFQPFYRGGHGRRIVQGMGLGLSIARDIAMAHGGGIELRATESGSCFILQIPIV
jgi:two-component system sensor histidine kinase BaeS